jgi:hypothetical protein
MALSFEESKKLLAQKAVAPATMAMPSVDNAGIMTLESVNEDGAIAAYSTWTRSTKYDWYEEYTDDKTSTVDKNKNIAVDASQINITQEENSQYIPFEMSRYYDGYDLMKADIWFYYLSSDGIVGSRRAVNVSYDTATIKFGWLVDNQATHVAGKLIFEIRAYGANSRGEAYVWKTKPFEKMNVLQSLIDDRVIEIDDSWVQELVEKVAESVSEQVAKAQITDQVEAAERAAASAEQSSSAAQQYANDAASAATNAVSAVLSDYVKSEKIGNLVDENENPLTVEEFVNKAVESVDVSEQLGDLGTNKDGTTKTVVQYVDEAVASVDVSDQLKQYATIEQIGELGVDDEGNPIATVVGYVDNKVSNINISEQLGDLGTNKDGSVKTVKQYVDDAVDAVDVSDQLKEYYTKTEVNLQHQGLSGNISSLGSIVGGLQETLKGIDTSPRLTYDIVYNDTEDPNGGENVLVLYEIENENTENQVKTPKAKYTIIGGSGSGGSSAINNLKIYFDKDENGNNITQYVFTTENVNKNEAVICYEFVGTDPVGDSVSSANATWQIRKGKYNPWSTIATETVYPNAGIEFNVSKYISVNGDYDLKLSVSDESGGFASKTWSIQSIELKIDSTFIETRTYPIGAVSFTCTPYGGNISKEIHFILDGKPIGSVTTTSSGIPIPYDIPAQAHGSHLIEAYMTAMINNIRVGDDRSIYVAKDIVWFDSESDIPVIGCSTPIINTRQYNPVTIKYTVFDKNTETPEVTWYVNGTAMSSEVLTEKDEYGYYTKSYKANDSGVFELKITCGEAEPKIITLNVEELDIDVTPVTAGLAFDFNPSGYSNSSSDRLWTNGTVSMEVSPNFDWVNGGYQYDENGDQYFCIKAGTYATIDYKLFADDARMNGKAFKLVFKTTNVSASDATFLTCVDNTTGSNHIGIQMNVHEAYIYGETDSLELPYSEDDIIEFEFNISKDTDTIPMVMAYEDGVSTRPMVYNNNHNFTQNTPKVIRLGSDDCDLHIYRFKVYASSLTDREILSNFIADARNAEEMISRYNRNKIYDKNNLLDPDVLAEKCPWLRVIKIEAPYFTNDKDERIGGTTIQHIYKNGLRPSDNWIATDAAHSGQGTSSNNYGPAGRNLDLMIKRVKDKKTGIYVNENPIFTLSDGTTTNKVSLTDNSVPVNYFNVKVNIASSNNLTNPLLAKRYNEFNPYKRAFVRPIALEDRYTEDEIGAMSDEELAEATAALKLEEKTEIAKIKDTMEFYNCVVFVKETDTTQDSSGNYINHREFNNTDYNFYALGNIGDSKKTDDTRLTDMDDPYECCIEVMDVRRELSDFPANTIVNAMRYEEDDEGNKTYLWAKDKNLGILYELIDGEYVLTKDTTVDLTKTYYVDALEHDDFSEDYTYGWRYISNEDDENIVNYCHQKWIEAYRFVVRDLPINSEGKIDLESDEVTAWKSEFENYFVLNSILYYYLFTTRYCMVDNRAKNLFFHYGKTSDVDSEGNPIRKFDLAWDYDNDTSLGLNNYGAMVYRYGLEDIDVDENGVEVFRESDSTFFCRVRDVFADELESLYKVLESKNAWNASAFIAECDDWQSQFPEELWRLDIERKYIRTYTSSYINGSGRQEFLKTMANGKMKYHRRQWERSQEQYMASKYKTTTAGSDNNSIILRCQIPNWDSSIPCNYSLKLRAYDTIYLNVQYGTGNNPRHVRVKPDQLSEDIEINYTGETDIIKIYSAPFIRSLGDISACYPYSVSIGNANKLKELIVGNGDDGYDSPQDVSLEFGSNPLLEKINIENISGYKGSLDLSALNNLKELYAHGTSTSGVTFADGGKIEIAELPAINAITMKNLIYLTNLDVVDWSKLTRMTVENCDTVDLINILDSATSVNRVRIVGVDWELENGTGNEDAQKEVPLLNRLYALKGFDKSGYNTEQSVLSGKVHVPVIRQQKWNEYKEAWPDLEITYNTRIDQYAVTFKNADGTVLDVQYVDKGKKPVDPTTRVDNPIGTPTLPSTVSTDYTFTGWDSEFIAAFENLTYTATYTESTREYTIKYMADDVVLQETVAPYGTSVWYSGETPTYTTEESAYKYCLFNGWDTSGYVNGDKIVNAVFDSCQYVAGYFEGKGLSEMRPVEIYALTKLGLESNYVGSKDPLNITLGSDISYDDVEEKVLVETPIVFNGSNYIDTQVKLFDEDKDFVLAIDYTLDSATPKGSILAECYSDNDMSGFRLWNNSGVKLGWGTGTMTPASLNTREMIVLRHVKGENGIHIYTSNLSGETTAYVELSSARATLHNGNLVFGCSKADDDTTYENYASGTIYWSKVWYADLGNEICSNLAYWPHEQLTFEMCGFKRNYLSDGSNKRCAMSFLSAGVLSGKAKYSGSSKNAGGWASSTLNTYLNNRIYGAFPMNWKQLIKQVQVKSSIGNKSVEISKSDCYIYIPALYELDATKSAEPYFSEVYPAATIDYILSKDFRICTDNSGTAVTYWTRSPNDKNDYGIHTVDVSGEISSYVYPYTENHVRIMFSI